MAQKLLSELPEHTLANSAGIISVDGEGKAKRIPKNEFFKNTFKKQVIFSGYLTTGRGVFSQPLTDFNLVEVYFGKSANACGFLTLTVDSAIDAKDCNGGFFIYDNTGYTKIAIDEDGVDILVSRLPINKVTGVIV